MKIYECIKPFKTTMFKKNNETPERIEINSGTDWFLAKKESNDRVVLCDNKIELVVANDILKSYFKLIMQ